MFIKLLLYSCKQSAVCLPSCPSAYASISILDSVSMWIFLHCSGTGGVFPFKTTSSGRIYRLHLPPRLNHILPGKSVLRCQWATCCHPYLVFIPCYSSHLSARLSFSIPGSLLPLLSPPPRNRQLLPRYLIIAKLLQWNPTSLCYVSCLRTPTALYRASANISQINWLTTLWSATH